MCFLDKKACVVATNVKQTGHQRCADNGTVVLVCHMTSSRHLGKPCRAVPSNSEQSVHQRHVCKHIVMQHAPSNMLVNPLHANKHCGTDT